MEFILFFFGNVILPRRPTVMVFVVDVREIRTYLLDVKRFGRFRSFIECLLGEYKSWLCRLFGASGCRFFEVDDPIHHTLFSSVRFNINEGLFEEKVKNYSLDGEKSSC